MAEVTLLKRHRTQVKSSLSRAITNFNNINKNTIDQNVVTELSLRLRKIEPLIDKFEDIQTQIEMLGVADDDEGSQDENGDEGNLNENMQERTKFEQRYFSLVGDIQSTIDKFNKSVSVNSSAGSSVPQPNIQGSDDIFPLSANQSLQQVKLPTINLPTFNGQYKDWVEFKDSFNALINDNVSLSNNQKFYYLRSSLQKVALQVIESIQVTATNYTIAWQLLQERFEQEDLIVSNHIQSIIEYPNLTKESHVELRKLFDSITKDLRSLESLGRPVRQWDDLLVYLIASKFDTKTRKEWELFEKEGKLSSMGDINKFLKKRCQVLEKMSNNIQNDKGHVDYRVNKFGNNKTKTQSQVYLTNIGSNENSNKYICYICKNNHTIFQCEQFMKASPEEKIELVKKQKLCYNCLRPNHSVKDCKSSNCRKCGKRHNSFLHLETSGQSGNQLKVSQEVSNSSTETSTNLHSKSQDNQKLNSQVLLSTAMITVLDADGNLHLCRALLDNCAQSNFITEKLCNTLKLPIKKTFCSITGIGQKSSDSTAFVELEYLANDSSDNSKIKCLILPHITDNLPTMSFNTRLVKIPSNIKLADPSFNKSSSIDILLGTATYWKLICDGRLKVEGTDLTMQETKLGWILGGTLNVSDIITHQSINFCAVNKLDNDQLNNELLKFWQIEEINNKPNHSISEQFCENHFVNNVKRMTDGHFMVKIPLKENAISLGQSKEMSKNRFLSQERKLIRNPSLYAQYRDFMQEYEQLGHMTEIETSDNDTLSYYVPHHAVIREESHTTKLRVVFDASMKTSNGLSLNDIQYVGATIQNDLFSILCRFRKHEFVMTADISKMYRMIFIDPEQRALQRIFWRYDPNDNLKCYQLNTVTYGTSSAPFLAIRCLYQLAIENEKLFPIASQVIKTDFYVDDLITGADSQEKLLKLQGEINKILRSGGFELRKWLSNDRELCNKFEVNDVSFNILSIGGDEPNKTLGILWNSNSDIITYSASNFTTQNRITKRMILSSIAQIYDPLGLLGPIVIVAKLLIQLLWQAKIGWDEEIPIHLKQMWMDFCDQLRIINDIKIPRKVLISNHIYTELHVFADASEKAYGAAIYLRSKNQNQEVYTALITAKSKVAPIKQVSLPRLELCATVLGAQLASRVVESLGIKFDRICYWTDSTIALCWIKASPNKWKTFVANRVSEVQRLSDPNRWVHVASKDNPADLISRGTSVQLLGNSGLWFRGPSWLGDNDLRVEECSEFNCSEAPEQRAVVVNLTAANEIDVFTRHSSLQRLIRTFAYVLRFVRNSKSRLEERKRSALESEELDCSLGVLLKVAQQQSFSEYKTLEAGQKLSGHSKILNLNPFLDSKNLIRVGGRIQRANCGYDVKHPIILSSNHPLTKLIFKQEHKKGLHCGPTNLLASIRQTYWPLSGRNLARDTVRQCVRCFRCNPPKPEPPLMGNLPYERVNQSLPFENTGCDFAGPFLLRDRNTRSARGSKLIKGYVCLFICLATKAIHLEVVSDLSSSCFIAALKRFIGRRGKPHNIYSDNGSNFVGANSELKNLYSFLESKNIAIHEFLSENSLKWHFIPARAPNFGGIWEASVKRVKFHLIRVVGQAHLNFEDFNTVLIQIESILNSTPLCPLSANPDQQNPLTPAHFLIGRPLTALPDRDVTKFKENHLKRYQRLQQMVQHFWARWHREYMCELQKRVKWQRNTDNKFREGTIVLLADENSIPLQWAMGKVIQLHPGDDGIVRVVTVQSRGRTLKRPVSRLRVFPFENY